MEDLPAGDETGAAIDDAPVGSLAWSLQAAPSAAVVAVLDKVDPQELPGSLRVDLLRAWERVASWVAARQQVALSSVAEATQELGLPGHLARHEVGAALRLAPGTAYDRCRRAEELTGRLAPTLSALHVGQINLGQACAVADAVQHLDDEVTAAVQTRVLARAARQTAAETRVTLRRAVLFLDPAGAAQRAAQAYAERVVTKEPCDDAMTEIRAVLSATDAQRVWGELSFRASTERARLRGAGLPHPGIDALRADALVAAVLSPTPRADAEDTPRAEGADTPRADRKDPEAQRTEGQPLATTDRRTSLRPRGGSTRSRASVQVTIDAPTLLGLAEHPGELAGYGPIPAQLARELAADGDWIRWTTDPQTGQLLDINTHVYRPNDALAAFVRAAHPQCGWVGCRQPSTRCDLDHIVDYDRGPTNRVNLGPLCRQHHNAKTHGRWQYRRDPDNSGHLLSPLGHVYDIPPPEHVPF